MTTAPYSSDTNWTISRGSLNSIISYESFDFPIESDSITRKPPLLLIPPSDSQPCQIKLTFTKKHEIRQVYIKSTARVYEIYYAPTLQSDDEYLCTVRCSAADIEDQFFSETDDKEVIDVNMDDPSDVLTKTRVLGENKIGTNEDDWVEIKLPADRVGGNTYLPNQQNYYEATAEINDLEPCMSLTLRLLSLQSKGCVYIDEVYVFADPIETDDSENQIVNAENSSNSSLMTMLVPTLLGLTKSRSAQLHDQNSFNPAEKPIEPKLGSSTLTNPVNLVDQQGDKLPKQCDIKVPDSTPDKDNLCDSTMRNAYSYNRVESLLEQLVSRVSRIEDVILRFEENMLKPINSIEARLERVEQQIELLSKTSQSPRFESNLGSTSNAENDSQLCDEPELEKMEIFSNGISEPPEDTAVVASTQVHEVLVTDEKEEASGVLELPNKEKPKKTISIDDALAAALAGLSSFPKDSDIVTDVPLESREEECLKTNQDSIDTTLESNSKGDASSSCESLEATAPEFTEEEIDCDENVLSSTSELSLGERGESSTTPLVPYTEIPDHIFRSHGDSEVSDDEAVDPTLTFNFPSPRGSYKMDPHLVKQDFVKEVKILTFDKNDILKHFPDQSPGDSCSPNAEDVNDESASKVSFESPILELTSASLENGNLNSHLEALLSYTYDPDTTNKGSSITPQTNEETTTVNNLLVDLDDGDVSEGVIQDLPSAGQEASFASLI